MSDTHDNPPAATPTKPPRRFWTPAEDAILRRDYALLGGPAVARNLNRSLRSIYARVYDHDLAHQHRTDTANPAFRQSLRELHAVGLADPEVARRLGCDRHVVSEHRHALGLPTNRFHARQRSQVARTTRQQCRDAGVKTLADVRVLAFRRYASSSGWPTDLSPREVHILEALETRGPLTRPEIAEAIGLPWIGSRRSLKSRTEGGSYLATLIRRGLVVSLGRLVRNGGKGRNLNLYALAMTAQRERQAGLESESEPEQVRESMIHGGC